MFFFLQYKGPFVQLPELVYLDAPASTTEPGKLYLFSGRQRILTFQLQDSMLLLMGDPVYDQAAEQSLNQILDRSDIDLPELYTRFKGHYYWFWLRPGRGFAAGTSFGGIFPIYYRQVSAVVELSSSSFFLAKRLGTVERDRRNLLERFLFNYPFFNSTWWKSVKLLEAHSVISLDAAGTQVQEQLNLAAFFGSPEKQSKADLKELVDLFLAETSQFLPDTDFGISLTGGFDGRTLVATARAGQRPFYTYSFGNPNSSDITLPQQQAGSLGIPYEPIILDQDYLQNAALDSAKSFMSLSEYNGNFGRPHYHYAATLLAERSNYIITGNFGSELFRALHIAGVMMSQGLIELFSAKDQSWKDFLRREKTRWLDDELDGEFDELVADLERYLEKMKDWDGNHRFYYFVYNDIFRKYFGSELVMQSHFLNNRTPYLNFTFFRALNQSMWSGLHSELFEKGKQKRMKGQFFYSTLIREADRRLYRMNTNKGYSPADVIEGWRFPLLLGKIGTKKILKKKEYDENLSRQAFRSYHQELQRSSTRGHHLEAFDKRLGKSLAEIPDGHNLSYWVKFYSIAYGWQAANI